MTLQSEIQSLVSKFAADLEALVRRAAVDAVTMSLGGGSVGPAVTAPKRPGRKRKAASIEKVEKVEKVTAPKLSRKAGKRVRRSADDIAKLGQSIADYVRANPGSNAEKIKAGLKIPRNQWMLSVGWALDNKKVSRKGEKRAAVYSPSGAPAIVKPSPVPPIKRAK